MFEQLVTPGYAPFTIALGLLIGIVAIEGLSMVAGHSASHLFESLFDGEGPDAPMSAGSTACSGVRSTG